MKLTGRTILITGGSAGIGLAFALKFIELGNEVIVTGRRQAVLDDVKAKYPKLHTIQSAVTNLWPPCNTLHKRPILPEWLSKMRPCWLWSE